MSAEHDGCGIAAYVPEIFNPETDWEGWDTGGGAVSGLFEFGNAHHGHHSFEVWASYDYDLETCSSINPDDKEWQVKVLGEVGRVDIRDASDWAAFRQMCDANGGLEKVLAKIKAAIVADGRRYFESEAEEYRPSRYDD